MKNEVFHIVHETEGRLRLKSFLLADPALDETYFEAYLEGIEEIKSVRINPKAYSLVINYEGGDAAKQKILATLERLPTEILGEEAERPYKTDLGEIYRTGIGLFFSFILPKRLVPFLSWFFCFPTLLRGVDTLFTRGLKVEVLDATAILLSLKRHDYFTANAINFLVTVGEYLEESTERKSHHLIRQLLRPPLEKTWIEKDKKEVEVDVKSLQVGDIVIGHTGEIIPIDGTVIAGEAMVNQSAITGEFLPVHCKKGNQVFAGSIIEEGKIKIRVETVKEETTLARMGKLITTALKRPAPFQRESEVLANKLVPLTFALGTGTFFITRDLEQTAAVFSVDYSCALKLSAPIALRASMYRAAKEGVLIRDGKAWEKLSQVDTFVFDKTGTLTQRHPQLSKIIPLNKISPQKILSLAVSAEAPYTHPVAKTLVKEAEKRGIKPLPHSLNEFIVAHGVSALVEGREIIVGNRHFLEKHMGIDCSKADPKESELFPLGKSLLYVAQDKKLIALLVLEEKLRAEAKKAVKELRKIGIKRIIMLTGDHKETALAIGKALEIEEVKWGLLPVEKAAVIESLKNKGRKVAFVGDGVNDAPALVAADVGICLREGASLAKETASVILQKEDLSLLPWAYSFSRKVIKHIRENFYFTVGVNSGLLGLAFLQKINPLLASILHNTTTVGILFRSLSLKGEQE